MKINEFKIEAKKKSLKAMERDLLEKEKNYSLEMTHEATREKKNPSKIKKMRHEIAILKTIIREKIVETIS